MLLLYSWKEIYRCKGRSLIAIAGYSFAALIFGIFISLLLYSNKSIGKILNNTGTHFISYKPLCCGLPYINNHEYKQNFVAEGIPSQPLPISLLSDIKKIPEVLDAAPFLLYRIKDEQRGSNFLIGGIDVKNNIALKSNSCSATDIISGRFLQEKDSNSVIIEETYASTNGIRTGSEITIEGNHLNVTGIINSGVRPAKADVYMLYNTAEKIIGSYLDSPLSDVMNIVLVESFNAHSHKKAMKEVNKLMGNSGLISTYNCFRPASQALDINQNLLWLLILFSIGLVILFSFFNRYSSIIERQHDFGILAAIGWSNGKITGMIFLETLIQTIAGGFLGLLILALFMSLVPFKTLFNSIVIETSMIIEIYFSGFFFLLIFAVLSSIFALLTIMRKLPSDNLRLLY